MRFLRCDVRGEVGKYSKHVLLAGAEADERARLRTRLSKLKVEYEGRRSDRVRVEKKKILGGGKEGRRAGGRRRRIVEGIKEDVTGTTTFSIPWY